MSLAGEAVLGGLRQEPLPWRRGVLWLLFLGPFFFLTYGFANGWAAARGVSASVVFAWERQIPFLPWTIVPYWSIDLLYGLSFLLCRTRRAVDTHALRLLTAQLVCIACFLLFPLRFSFERPSSEGVFGAMFALLMGFDQPYNQAPSLHIVLLVVLWVRYTEASRGFWRWLTHGWAALIALSVLTTFQHHFIDLASGLLVGLLCVWCWPDEAHAMPAQWKLSADPRRRLVGLGYLLGAAAVASLAFFGGWALWLGWPATALLLVGLNYLGLGVEGFQKRQGQFSAASAWLFAPYRWGAWLNVRIWTWHQPAASELADGVWLGRLPTPSELAAGGYAAIVDLTAEFATPSGPWRCLSLPTLDLVPPDALWLSRAADGIEQLRTEGRVLVFCALGYSRSAAAAAAWLLRSGRAATVEQAIALLGARRPHVVLTARHRAALQEMLALTGVAGV